MFDESRIPCKVIIEPKEDGDEVVFLFDDQIKAAVYERYFPAPYYSWISWFRPFDAFFCKRNRIH